MANEIEGDILMSAAVFVFLGETVQQLPNTSHWIVYESATCDRCFVSYEVHMPTGRGDFRCAGCSKLWSVT